MLEQKGNQLRKTKDELEEATNKLKDKEVQVEKNTLENQELKVKLQKLISTDNTAKTAYNAELLLDQNKQLKNRIEQIHKQSILKDNEITHLQSRQADYEKRIVLLQQQTKDNKLLQKLHQENGINQAHIKSLMMPFSSSTNINRSNFGTQGGFGPQGFGNFYNQQVYKPIRGGGAAPNSASQALNFSEFMES
jgi:transcription-repair coupling factor (superfamily II helicase)